MASQRPEAPVAWWGAVPLAARSVAGWRESNQDRTCQLKLLIGGQPAVLMAVADGMGGLQDGEKAAEAAIGTVRELATRILPHISGMPDELRSFLSDVYREANRRVWALGVNRGEPGSVGSTLVVCISFEDRFLVANVGDSRCYKVSDDETIQLTRDHNQRSDGPEETEAAYSDLGLGGSHVLTRSLGEPEDVIVDISPPYPNWGIVDGGCLLVLCSDGLHGSVPADEIHRQFQGTPSVEAACSNLVSLAFARGATDNITVVACEVEELERAAPAVQLIPDVEVLMATQQRRLNSGRPSNRIGARTITQAVLIAAFVLVAAAFVGVWWESRGGSVVGPRGAAPLAGSVGGGSQKTDRSGVPAPSEAPAPEESQSKRAESRPPSRPDASASTPTRRTDSSGPGAPAATPSGPPTAPGPTSTPKAETAAVRSPTVAQPQEPAQLPLPPKQPKATGALRWNLPQNLSAEATSPAGAPVIYQAAATDSQGRPVSVNCSPSAGSTFKLGSTPVNCSAVDAEGTAESATFTVEVRDTTPPRARVTVKPEKFTKHTGRLEPVTLGVFVEDVVDPEPECRVVSVKSSDPPADVKARESIDHEIVGMAVRVRTSPFPEAERVYTITVGCKDRSGNEALKSATVRLSPVTAREWRAYWR